MVNMNKIGNKLLVNYLILLIVIFMVSSIVFNVVSKQYLINETREQLILEGQKIADILKRENLDKVDIRSTLKTQFQLRIAGRFIDSDMIILNRHDIAIYADVEGIDKKDTLQILRSEDPIEKGYVVTRVPIFDIKGSIKGNIFMLAKVKNINEFISK